MTQVKLLSKVKTKRGTKHGYNVPSVGLGDEIFVHFFSCTLQGLISVKRRSRAVLLSGLRCASARPLDLAPSCSGLK